MHARTPMIRLSALTLFIASVAAAQSFDQQEYDPDDTIKVTGPCNQSFSMSLQLPFGWAATGLNCEMNKPVLEFEIGRDIDEAYLAAVAFLINSNDAFDAPPARSPVVAYIVNPIVPENGLIHLNEDQFLGGSILSGHILRPTQADENFYTHLVLYRPQEQMVSGAVLTPWEVSISTEIDGSIETFSVTLPRFPGRYELQLRNNSGFVIESRDIVVQPNYPDFQFEAPEGGMLSLNGGVIRLETQPDVPSGMIVSFQLLRENPQGGWMIEGYTQQNDIYGSDGVDEWANYSNDVLVFPQNPGSHRLVVLSSEYPAGELTMLGDFEFEVGPAEPQTGATLSIHPFGVMMQGETIEVGFSTDTGYMAPPYLIDLYQYDRDEGSFHPGMTWDLSEGEPDMRFEVSPETPLILPMLEPGEYALFLRSDHPQLPSFSERTHAALPLTILDPDAFAIELSSDEILLGEQLIAKFSVQDRFEEIEHRLYLDLVHLGGWGPGCKQQLPRSVYGGQVTGIGLEMRYPGGELFDGPPLLTPGDYELRLSFGSISAPFGYATDGLGPIILARAPFTVRPEPFPVHLSVDGETIRVEDQQTMTIQLPDENMEDLGQWWQRHEFQLYRDNELARSGAIRISQQGCWAEWDRNYESLSDEGRFECRAAGYYTAQTLLRLGCFMGYCPRVETASASFVVYPKYVDDPAMQPVPESTLPVSNYGDWSEAGNCREPDVEQAPPELAFVRPVPPFDPIEQIVLQQGFRVLLKYDEPPLVPPISVTLEIGEEGRDIVSVEATDNPRLFLSAVIVAESQLAD